MAKSQSATLWTMLCAATILAGVAAATPTPARADDHDKDRATNPTEVILPLIVGWYNGKPAPYISTEASDPGVAKDMGANYVPKLASAADSDAVDDIYAITNFKQGNIIPSRPKPAGPGNKDFDYTPLWQISKVTWTQPSSAHLLKSEAEVLAAETSGLVSIEKTRIVVNCSVVYTPSGGLFPHAKLLYPRER